MSGSLRRASYNSALLRAAMELLPEGVTLAAHDLRSVPMYDGDVEAVGLPAPVVEFREAIRAADGVLFVTPEYNYGYPAVLKNALDWASRGKDQPLLRKPVAVTGVSAGGFGTVRAQLALRQVFLGVDARLMQRPELHVGNASKQFSPQGALTDESTREKLRAFLAAFADQVRAQRSLTLSQ
ncbi:MAG: NADPH-dependent FMN reductase [Candidatus Eisenbacteria bacterium]